MGPNGGNLNFLSQTHNYRQSKKLEWDLYLDNWTKIVELTPVKAHSISGTNLHNSQAKYDTFQSFIVMQQYILVHVNLDKFRENPGTFAHTYSYLHEQYWQ